MLAVTAVGADRPGIIARVTGVLHEHGANLADSSMTILGGHFTIMLLVDSDADPQRLEAALGEATADMGLAVRVAEVGPGHDSGPPTHVVSVYGADRPGLVHAASQALADAGVNITDLNTQVLGTERPVYACVMEVSLPEGSDEQALEAMLRDAVADVEVSVAPVDVETL